MPYETHNFERFLSVGTIVIFHLDPNRKDGPRCKTVVRGWRKSSHIMVDRPLTQSGAYLAMHEGQACVARFVQDGLACAFDTVVVDWDTRKHSPYMRISWPKQLEYVSFRRHERIRLAMLCDLHWLNGSSTVGTIKDISVGGCGIFTNICCEANSTVKMDFALPDGSRMLGVDAVVRSTREAGEQFFLGCEFAPDQEQVSGDLAFYITTSLSRMRADARNNDSKPCVLLLEPDQVVIARVRQGLERRGIEVIPADNAIEGFYRLKMSQPVAVAVNQQMEDLPGLDLCRIISMSPDFARLPVFVYGGDMPEIGALVAAVGGKAYFQPGLTMIPDVVQALTRTVKQAVAEKAAEKA
jgi:ActR/RegA family two-component response regulator/c-di-GMP-binding flagellar brake protein YcgR